MKLASRTYNREHFMHYQLIVLLIVIFGISSEMFFKLLKESELTPKSREFAYDIHENNYQK